MKEPGFLEYGLLITCSLVMSLIGLYLLANFGSLFRGSIRNELIRRNVVAWLVIFCITVGLLPLSGGFFHILGKFGWKMAIAGQLISITLITLFVFNVTRLVAENKKLQQLSFVKHKLLVFATLIITILAINVPVSYFLYDYSMQYLKYSVASSIYLGGATGLVYAAIDYLELERKRRFQEKELELSKMREGKARAELDALHSKVNPHFLYNALNSIADLSITDGGKARRMTVALADLFRYSINYSRNNFSTIQEEVEMAEVYLQIEKIRFEDKLNYHVFVDEEANHYLVPRFVLQPLVENAVKHGLKATGKMTDIHLEVKKEGEMLVLRVEDNGPGFPQELNAGYGVKSVYDKLDLLFAGNYAISFMNAPRKQVIVHLQKLIKNEPSV